jgi:hypothetical protein
MFLPRFGRNVFKKKHIVSSKLSLFGIMAGGLFSFNLFSSANAMAIETEEPIQVDPELSEEHVSKQKQVLNKR